MIYRSPFSEVISVGSNKFQEDENDEGENEFRWMHPRVTHTSLRLKSPIQNHSAWTVYWKSKRVCWRIGILEDHKNGIRRTLV